MDKPLAVDLYCGLGGWSDGLLAAGYDVVGFDIEHHVYGEHRYPAQLVLQDVRTLHGKQFKDAALIVASPPCQEYSYMAMPWSKAKAIQREYETGVRDKAKLTELFDACFRIQREACEAAGRHIPMVVENVRGACKWVGRSRWNYGSYHLWGDVPALMPMTMRRPAFKGGDRNIGRATGEHVWNTEFKIPGFRFDGSGRSFQTACVENVNAWAQIDGRGTSYQGERVCASVAKTECKECPKGKCSDCPRIPAHKQVAQSDGHKVGHDWFGGYGGGCGWDCSPMRRNSSKSSARKAASAMIARIPFALAYHIAKTYYPSARR